MAKYQTTWRDGLPLETGQRDCGDRWAMIAPELAEIQRPFTMLDVGAAQGYFSARAAEEFDCFVTAIDPNPDLRAVGSPTIKTIIGKVDRHSLAAMPRVDVVLALSVLHHFPKWREVFDRLRQCREFLIVETPHPDEDWMRSAAARGHLPEIHALVQSYAVKRLGTSPRASRDGKKTYERPVYLVPGTIRTLEGRVFAGSGTNSRKMPRYSKGLDKRLGYQPTPGSLNLRLDRQPRWGEPAVDWLGRHGSSTRDYQMWDAWIGETRCHAMRPGKRGHGPDCVEMIAAHRLRNRFGLADGDTVRVDVEQSREVLRLKAHGKRLHIWDVPGKISKSWRAGKPYESQLLEHIYRREYSGVAVDVGANIGNHSLWLAKMCGLSVHAFEPVWSDELSRNLALNPDANVTAYPCALGDAHVAAKHVGKGRLKIGSGNVRVERFDDYAFEDVALIKIDVEGMETHVLLGALATLREQGPDVYAETWDGEARRRIDAVLQPLEYRQRGQFRHSKNGTVMTWWSR